jgi:hypothetical protein
MRRLRTMQEEGDPMPSPADPTPPRLRQSVLKGRHHGVAPRLRIGATDATGRDATTPTNKGVCGGRIHWTKVSSTPRCWSGQALGRRPGLSRVTTAQDGQGASTRRH